MTAPAAEPMLLDPQQPLPPEQDFLVLREEAISSIATLAGTAWSNVNTSEPGLILLEAAANAMTDLGYRLSHPLPDLLAPARADEPWQAPWTADAVLPSAPVSDTDWRLAMLDEPNLAQVQFSPLVADRYNPLLKLTVTPIDLPDNGEESLRRRMWSRWQRQRPLGNDLTEVVCLKPVRLRLFPSVCLKADASPEDTVADLLWAWKNQLCRRPAFRQWPVIPAEQRYDGPLLAHGYLSPDSLAEPSSPHTLLLADLVACANQVPGVERVHSLQLSVPGKALEQWKLVLAEGTYPELDVEQTLQNLCVTAGPSGLPPVTNRSGLPISLRGEQVRKRLAELANRLDLDSAPVGGKPARYRQLRRYRPFSHDLPGRFGLSSQAVTADCPAAQLASIRQLQAFLLLLEQTLSNQFAQLESVRALLAFPAEKLITPLEKLYARMLASDYLMPQEVQGFWQALSAWPATLAHQPVGGLGELPSLLSPENLAHYQSPTFGYLTEPQGGERWLDRQQRRLSHLLARYQEDMPDAGQLRYRGAFSHYLDTLMASSTTPRIPREQLLNRVVRIKCLLDLARWLLDYPALSRDRSLGADLDKGFRSRSGLERRIAARLGIVLDDTTLSTGNREGFYLIEGVLLRDIRSSVSPADFGRFSTLYLVWPNWPSRFTDPVFRQLVQDTVQAETPVHLIPEMLWLDRERMQQFEVLQRQWRGAMAYRPPPAGGTGNPADEKPDDATRRERQIALTSDMKRLMSVLTKERDEQVPLPGQPPATDWSRWTTRIQRDEVTRSFIIGPQPAEPLRHAVPLPEGQINSEPQPFTVSIPPSHPLDA